MRGLRVFIGQWLVGELPENRPVHEVLFSARRDIAQEYERNFQGMTAESVALNDLLEARDRMMRELQSSLDGAERRFLLTLVTTSLTNSSAAASPRPTA